MSIRVSSRPLVVALALVVVGLVWLAVPASSLGRDVQPLEVGSAAPDFELPGIDGRTYRLADFADAQILMVVFTCNHCPTAQAYEQRLIRLHEDYRERGVALVAITPNDPESVRLDELGYSDLNDTLEETRLRAEQVGFEFPYLYDGDKQDVTAAYGPLVTPHVFIFDADRRLRYAGRIDDSEVGTITSHDARNALDALLDGRPVPVAETRVFGCSIKWSEMREEGRRFVERWNQEPVELRRAGPEEVRQLVANDTDRYRLINVWATWCIPCRDELPELLTIHRMYRGRPFELVTISADELDAEEQARKVLADHYLSSTNLLFESPSRDELFDSVDSEWQGGIPYTILVAPGGEIVYRKHGRFDALELKRAIVERLGRTYASP